MSSKRVKRITNEIKELELSSKILEDSGIFFHYDENNINIINAMLYGPPKTPYEKGFYFFTFEYPQSYPMEPPIAKYYTQGRIKNPSKNAFNVRFNPNLYDCGKVCLSMLNTWSGPGWVPTNTISNVLVAIQALVLNEEPLRNEPGFENSSVDIINRYSELISYANIKIAVLEMILEPPAKFVYFKTKMKELFLKNIDFYRTHIASHITHTKNVILVSPAYGMQCTAEYNLLQLELNRIENEILNISIEKSIENIENIKIS